MLQRRFHVCQRFIITLLPRFPSHLTHKPLHSWSGTTCFVFETSEEPRSLATAWLRWPLPPAAGGHRLPRALRRTPCPRWAPRCRCCAVWPRGAAVTRRATTSCRSVCRSVTTPQRSRRAPQARATSMARLKRAGFGVSVTLVARNCAKNGGTSSTQAYSPRAWRCRPTMNETPSPYL